MKEAKQTSSSKRLTEYTKIEDTYARRHEHIRSEAPKLGLDIGHRKNVQLPYRGILVKIEVALPG